MSSNCEKNNFARHKIARSLRAGDLRSFMKTPWSDVANKLSKTYRNNHLSEGHFKLVTTMELNHVIFIFDRIL